MPTLYVTKGSAWYLYFFERYTPNFPWIGYSILINNENKMKWIDFTDYRYYPIVNTWEKKKSSHEWALYVDIYTSNDFPEQTCCPDKIARTDGRTDKRWTWLVDFKKIIIFNSGEILFTNSENIFACDTFHIYRIISWFLCIPYETN